MQKWQRLLEQSITSPAELAELFSVDTDGLEQVAAVYPMRINPYYLDLIREHGSPLWRQAVPDRLELEDPLCPEDPLNEENLSPVPGIVHRYPDRVLFLVAAGCAMYCRFCTRKRKVGTARMRLSDRSVTAGLEYLRQTPAVREVLLSGGDPLLLEDDRLEWLLGSLRAIPSLEIIRIGTRVPCTMPARVTAALARLLKKFPPLYINTHFNHPAEVTEQAATACRRLADAGIPLGNQTVLLKGVNDSAAILNRLFKALVKIRVRPYYLFQGDLTKGTNHFRTPVRQGLSIMHELTGALSWPALPTFALDLPGGGGKVTLAHDHAAAADRTGPPCCADAAGLSNSPPADRL